MHQAGRVEAICLPSLGILVLTGFVCKPDDDDDDDDDDDGNGD
ncbi:hypothetical protein E2C01_087645 [Portunus trituberculatus]|uniref:Uncharacterized protein n=1 Tax=Portunus trituberculatus TaxID=210409 RepID=A0A5B7J751_PORTR|nr:hypothetical protein [Portunus trituberculatus]